MAQPRPNAAAVEWLVDGHFVARFSFAQRARCAAAIRARPAALIFRFFPGFLPGMGRKPS